MNLLRAIRLLLKRFGWILILVIIVLLVFDPDGWRAFLLDIIGSLLAHAIITLLLFGILVFMVSIAQRLLDIRASSRGALRIVFLVAAVTALALLRTLSRRPIDFYDLGQVVVFVIAFESVLDPLSRIIRKQQSRSLFSGRKYAVPFRPVPHTPVERELYGKLLSRVLGNRETADSLIAYEQTRAPRASLAELIANALERLVRDNRP